MSSILYSKQAFFEFLEIAKEAGIYSPKAANDRLSAIRSVFEHTKIHDHIDLNTLNIAEVQKKYKETAKDKLSELTLKIYSGSFKSSLNAFIKYVKDPNQLKIKGKKSTINLANTATKQQTTEKNTSPVQTKSVITKNITTKTNDNIQPLIPLIFPIPIRKNVVVSLHNIPYDLTTTEAEKISSVLKALSH